MTIRHPSFGAIDDRRVFIFDTTLRDGEQSPGFSMNTDEKLRMAHALAALGVDVIEAGFPAASKGDFDSVRQIAEQVDGPVICALARSGGTRDIEAAGAALKKAKRGRIHNFISTSPLHMKYKLRMDPETVLEIIAKGNDQARHYTDDVEWSAEDGSRTEPDFLCRCVETAIRHGATTINIPDTVGFATPDEIQNIFAMLRARVPGADGMIFSTHNHNDLGLAVANTVSALEGGARQIECTINGIGERAGNAALEEVVMALRTRHDRYGLESSVETPRLLGISRLLAAITGFDVQPNKAIVGRNAFAHESGIHQDGVLKHAGTYEIMTPESVGWNRTSLVLGKHSGRAAFRDKLASLGYDGLDEDRIKRAFDSFKALADCKKDILDEDIRALIDEEMRDHERIILTCLEVRTGLKADMAEKAGQRAEVVLGIEVDGLAREVRMSGNGPVDATFRAIGEAFPHQATLALFSVANVTEGTDAQARTTVRLQEEGRLVDGQGSDPDTVVSAARAYLHALNKLLVKRQRTAPQE